MYKDPANFNKMKGAFFQAFALDGTKCMEPTESCTEPLIDSHSIQDSRILEQLAFDYHVIQIEFDKACIRKSTLENTIAPACKFEPVSIHQASVFRGLCNKHDTELFKPIDTEDLDMDNIEHVFLLTYRSVFKELASKLRAARMTYSMLQSKTDMGELSENPFSVESMLAASQFVMAYSFNDYKRIFDAEYLAKDYHNIVWRYLILDNEPTFATSAVFSPMELALNPENPEKLCINVFPYKGKMYVLFSSRKEDETALFAYTDEIFAASGYYQKYLISKLVLRNCENTVFGYKYFNTWEDGKKRAILKYFEDTMNGDLAHYENADLYIF